MQQKKILIIDDEQEMSQLLKIELETEGWQVILAHSGEEGLEATRDLHPDLVLLDVMMPGMDGYQVLKILKAEGTTKDIPVVMLTAKGLEGEIQKGLDMGADDYIPKPFQSEFLIKRIQAILG